MQPQTTYTSHSNRLRFLRTTATALAFGMATMGAITGAHADKAVIVLRTATPLGPKIHEWIVPLPKGDGMELAENEGKRIFIRVRGETLTFELDVPKESVRARLQSKLSALRAKPATIEVVGVYNVQITVTSD